MKIKSFLKAIHAEAYVRIENEDGEELAFNQASSIIKYGDPYKVVVRAYPECSPLTAGKLAITVVVQDA
jgi:hypothetical protein